MKDEEILKEIVRDIIELFKVPNDVLERLELFLKEEEKKRIFGLINKKIKFQRLINTYISKQIIKVLKELKKEVENDIRRSQ